MVSVDIITIKEKYQAIETGRCPRCKSLMHFIPSNSGHPGSRGSSALEGHPAWLTCNEFENDCSFNWEGVPDTIADLILGSIFKNTRDFAKNKLSELRWAIKIPEEEKPKITRKHIADQILFITNALGERDRPAKYIEVM